ncbi:GWxTD domain-containing protein, partial [Candidatus Parcubacteria bacterium]
RVLALDPAYMDEEQGSAWLLLGRMVTRQRGKEAGLRSYLTGLGTLKLHGGFDPLLGEVCVQLIIDLEKVSYYQLATETFYQVLQQADARRHQGLLRRLYGQSAFLLPKEEQRRIERLLEGGRGSAHPGRVLERYWRGEDPTPATILNERLIEHLQRVGYAVKWYPAGLARGFDDRGMIYVRLGKPGGKVSAGVTGIDPKRNYNFLPHEVWFYEQIASDLFFPFVKSQSKRGYVLVDGIEEAIPKPRASNMWRIKLFAETPDFDSRLLFYNKLATSSRVFYDRVQELESLRSKYPPVIYGPYLNGRAVTAMEYFDHKSKIRRRYLTPKAVSEVLSDIRELPVAVRTARFLGEAGGTRLESYLGIRRQELIPEVAGRGS